MPSQVEYERATSVEHALRLVARPETRILAGGHSLIPMMKLRLAQPEVLVDINGLAELAYIRLDGGQLRIGALARHADLLDSAGRASISRSSTMPSGSSRTRSSGCGAPSAGRCAGDPSEDLSAVFAAARATAVIRPGGERSGPVPGSST